MIDILKNIILGSCIIFILLVNASYSQVIMDVLTTNDNVNIVDNSPTAIKVNNLTNAFDILDTKKVSTNDTRELDFTKATLYISNAIHQNSPITLGDMYSALEKYSIKVLYGSTNNHPIITNAYSMIDNNPLVSTTMTVTIPGNTLVLFGSYYYTNTVDFIRSGLYVGRFFATKAAARDLRARMILVYTNVITGSNAILATSAFEPIIDTALRSYRLSCSIENNIYNTNLYLGVLFQITNASSQATALTLYLGGVYNTHLETPGLNIPDGFALKSDISNLNIRIDNLSTNIFEQNYSNTPSWGLFQHPNYRQICTGATHIVLKYTNLAYLATKNVIMTNGGIMILKEGYYDIAASAFFWVKAPTVNCGLRLYLYKTDISNNYDFIQNNQIISRNDGIADAYHILIHGIHYLYSNDMVFVVSYFDIGSSTIYTNIGHTSSRFCGYYLGK